MVKKHWMKHESEGTDIQHRIGRLMAIWQTAEENLALSQDRMKSKFDKRAKARNFEKRRPSFTISP